MQNKSDAQLLRDYAQKGSDVAFREIVLRHTDLIYSAALRQVRSPDLAADVTQGVFTDLARKASTLAKTFTEESSILGWLYRSARFASLNTLRDERRRHEREREAMQQMSTGPEDSNDWDSVAPVLDEAMSELSDAEREAILLRFFKNHDFQKVGLALGVSDDTAQKRVSRALEKLRSQLNRRGVTLTAITLASAISTQAVHAAPLALTTTASTAVILSGITKTVVAESFMALSTTKSVLLAVSLAAAVGTGIYQRQEASRLREQVRQIEEKHEQQMGELREQLEQTAQSLAFAKEENARLQEASTASGQSVVGVATSNLGNQTAQQSSASPPNATQSDTRAAEPSEPLLTPAEERGREIAQALVQGAPDAFGKLVQFSDEERAFLRKALEGLNETDRNELHRTNRPGMRVAGKIIDQAAGEGNAFALKTIEKGLHDPALQGMAVKSLGELARQGSEPALQILLHPTEYGILLSSAVGALEGATEKGDERAIEFMAAVTRDPKSASLWFRSSQALSKAAVAGNTVALDAIIALSAVSDRNVRSVVVTVLHQAAAHQNAKAIEALKGMGIQPVGLGSAQP